MIVDLLNKKCHYPLEKGEYYIYDDEANHTPKFVNDDEEWNIKIVNNSNFDIDFFQNDGCLMTQNELKKCDWISIFRNKFYFIEAKDVKAGQRKKQRKDAIEKFNATIPYYLETYPALIDLSLYVIMNFRDMVKLTRAANKAKAFYFKEEFNAEYIETNHLDFK